MRIRRIEIERKFFGRHDLPYELQIDIQGTEQEIKETQKKILELIK